MLAFLAGLALAGAGADFTETRVDPRTVADDDFARHRHPAEWRGLRVTRIETMVERAAWRFWRIADPRRPRGPLWFVPHDNENAGFEAALVAVRRYGGTMIAIDSAMQGHADGTRLNHAVAYGEPVDPNRNFDSALPDYARQVLADLEQNSPIIALHTNASGFDSAESRCNRSDPRGEGIISIRFCDGVLTPSPSKSRAWPFDDDDSVAFATYRAGQTPSEAFCRDAMAAADFNVVQERVVTSDGSLSNYAVLHGLRYMNFETRDRGLEPAALADARERRLHMIDIAMRRCAPALLVGSPKAGRSSQGTSMAQEDSPRTSRS